MIVLFGAEAIFLVGVVLAVILVLVVGMPIFNQLLRGYNQGAGYTDSDEEDN